MAWRVWRCVRIARDRKRRRGANVFARIKRVALFFFFGGARRARARLRAAHNAYCGGAWHVQWRRAQRMAARVINNIINIAHKICARRAHAWRRGRAHLRIIGTAGEWRFTAHRRGVAQQQRHQ